MKLQTVVTLTIILIFVTACKGEIMKNSYDQGEITIEGTEQKTTDLIKIFYSSMSETLYYCPGANVTEAKDEIHVEFVRCSINDKCEVTHPAKQDEGREFILINNGTKPVYLKGNNSVTRISPN